LLSRWIKDEDGGAATGHDAEAGLPPCPTVLLIGAPAQDAQVQLALQHACAGLEAHGLAVKTMPLDATEADGNLDLRLAWLNADGVIVVGRADRLATLPQRLAVGQAPASGYLGDRAYGLVLAGREAQGGESARARLERWMDSLGMIDAASFGRLDLYFGYSRLDEGETASELAAEDAGRRLDEEVARVTQAMCSAVTELRAGRLPLLHRHLPAAGQLPA
jgi:hypothetical protein